jgi:hypothetical protein
MDFSFISTHFFDICLYLPAPLVLVIFDNTSIRKRVSCKSEGLKFRTFSACFVDFVSSSFFIRFCDIFEAILGSIWHHFWEKNPSENHFKKRGPPRWKLVIIGRVFFSKMVPNGAQNGLKNITKSDKKRTWNEVHKTCWKCPKFETLGLARNAFSNWSVVKNH